ncbi:hypothetical protein [Lachnoclostridium sp. Marseille-P6806]|jgi:hypothetical protein|uniref:hypothetical protein n=1 Tax=Lachnoclostridium sp. Marseille-P6806 TaxID=2364793 RepID=UPI0035628A4E
MSDILFPVSGGGGGNLDEITASAEYVKSPYTFMNSEGDIEEGTMVDRENWGAAVGMNDRVTVPEGYHDGSGEVYGPTVTQRGAWTSRLGINGKAMIPEGYHNGNGYVDQDISTLGEQKVVPKLSRHTLWTANQYMTGNVIIEPIPNQKNAATKALSNGVNSQGLYFYIPEGYYLPDGTGNSWVYQTLAEVAKALGITADKVKKGVTLCGVVGTFEGYVANANDLYYRGIYNNPMNLENSNMEFRSDCIAFPTLYTYYLHFTNPVNLSAYSKLIVEDARSGVFTTSYIDRQRLCVGSSVKPTTIKSVPTSVSGKSLVFDISSLQGSQYIRLGLYVASNAQIIRIRLE